MTHSNALVDDRGNVQAFERTKVSKNKAVSSRFTRLFNCAKNGERRSIMKKAASSTNNRFPRSSNDSSNFRAYTLALRKIEFSLGTMREACR